MACYGYCLFQSQAYFQKKNAYECNNVVFDEDLSEQINSGEVDTKISQVPYMASYGYEGEFYEYLLYFLI